MTAGTPQQPSLLEGDEGVCGVVDCSPRVVRKEIRGVADTVRATIASQADTGDY